MLRIQYLLFFLIILSGCSDEQSISDPNSQTDTPSDIDIRTGMAMLVYEVVGGERDNICELSIDDISFVPDSMRQEWMWRCEYLQKLWESTENHRVQIINGDSYDEVVYAFNVYYGQGGEYNYFSESTYGLFTDLNTCIIFEIEAHEYGIPTKKCGEWIHPFSGLGNDFNELAP